MKHMYDGIYSIIKRSVDALSDNSGTAALNVKFYSAEKFQVYFLYVYKSQDVLGMKEKLQENQKIAKKYFGEAESKIKKDVKEVFGKDLDWKVVEESFNNTKVDTSYYVHNPLSTYYYRYFKMFEITNLDSFKTDSGVKLG